MMNNDNDARFPTKQAKKKTEIYICYKQEKYANVYLCGYKRDLCEFKEIIYGFGFTLMVDGVLW